MTTEVAILNKQGVALAADSAVTLSRSKVYNSAPKIYMIADKHEVGLMIYNNAEFMRIPWEVIIQGFRASTYPTFYQEKEPHLEDYIKKFSEYISQNIVKFVSNANQREFVLEIFRQTIRAIIHLADLEVETITRNNARPVTLTEIQQVLENEIDYSLALYESKDDYVPPNTSDDLFSLVMNEYHSQIEDIIADIVEYRPLQPVYKERLVTLCGFLFSKNYELPYHYTGLVFVGFGKDDYFPKCYDFHVDSIICGKLRWIEAVEKRTIINPYELIGRIVSFAQDDIIELFMTGLHPFSVNGLKSELNSYLSESFPDSDDLDGYWKNILDRIGRNLSDSILRAVYYFPKSEMAAMAEALVTLTSFQRRVSMSQETVGGPVDVAVISKYDGFTWIKRKEYFNPDLNLHLFRH